MHIYVKNNLPNFIPMTDPIWNDGALEFFEERRPSSKKKNNMTALIKSSSQVVVQGYPAGGHGAGPKSRKSRTVPTFPGPKFYRTPPTKLCAPTDTFLWDVYP